MSKSALMGTVLRRLGICGLVLQARRRGWLRPDALTILGYHRIAELPTDGFHGEDDNISCAPAVFDREVALLRRFFTPLTFADLLAIRTGARPQPPNPLVITFDDGYRDNFAVAAPILERHGVPGVFFLTTGFLDGEVLPWWDAINRACRRAPEGEVRLASLEGLPLATRNPAERAATARAVRRAFRTLPAERYPEVLAELGAAAGCDLTPPAFRDSFMSWGEARTLAERGHEIGAHTRSHPVLTQVEPGRLDAEVRGARALLQERIGREVVALAYPVGGPSAVNEVVIEAARRAGFAFACTYQDGVNSLGRLDCLALRRIAVGAGATYTHFYAKLAFPWLFKRTNV